MNPHIFFLGTVEAGRLAARAAQGADHGAPVVNSHARASALRWPAARFWRRSGSR